MPATVTPLPFNRALHPDDYHHESLAGYVAEIAAFERRLALVGAPFRKDHAHRVWEYANVLRQLAELRVTPPAVLLDTGSGGSYLPALLATKGYVVTVSDSMAYGDCTEWVYRQCVALGIQLPIVSNPVEDLRDLLPGAFDVVCCVSVIEHVDPTAYEQAWGELARVAKVGGFLMVTSDYFRNLGAWEQSPFKQIQHNIFTPSSVEDVFADHPSLEPVGGVDLVYRGDFVNNYSFWNACLLKRA